MCKTKHHWNMLCNAISSENSACKTGITMSNKVVWVMETFSYILSDRKKGAEEVSV